jgi:glucose-6-phosphate 1-epimerase
MAALVTNDFGQIQQQSLENGLGILTIEHRLCQAKVSLYGGQVLSWQPKGQEDVFWLSKSATFEQGKAIRGGVPLCWPWFGSHPDDVENKAGNHGFARGNLWQVEQVDINDSTVEFVLVFQGQKMHDLWPYAFKLKQVLRFGKSFSQSLTMTNLSEKDAYISAALHSYFAVSSPEAITLDTLSDAAFDDKLTGQSCQAKYLANGVGPIDRVYYSNKTVNIVDHNWQRTIEVNASNSKQWVFWNPGEELATNMADIHLHGEQEFVCLEAANTEQQLLASGNSFTMSQQINVFNNHP